MKISTGFIGLSTSGQDWELVKVSDDKFEGSHPNGIVEGYLKRGIVSDLKVGNTFRCDSLVTSPVTEILSVDDSGKEILFKTINSTYKLSLLEELS